jgi:3-oxoacyl-[acyl-carrier protein] reductase
VLNTRPEAARAIPQPYHPLLCAGNEHGEREGRGQGRRGRQPHPLFVWRGNGEEHRADEQHQNDGEVVPDPGPLALLAPYGALWLGPPATHRASLSFMRPSRKASPPLKATAVLQGCRPSSHRALGSQRLVLADGYSFAHRPNTMAIRCKMPAVPYVRQAVKGRTDNLGRRMHTEGKVALVTGSSRGIGREIARELASRGARVAVHYRADREAAQETLTSLAGGPHAVFGADVADADAASDLVQDVGREMGGIDVLVNNAAIFESHPVPETDYAGWQTAWSRTIETNLLGPANLSYLVARLMRERGGGRVVNVSSRGAFRGEPETPAYGASKAGLNAFSQSMAQALAPYGILFPMASSSMSSPPGSSRPTWPHPC